MKIFIQKFGFYLENAYLCPILYHQTKQIVTFLVSQGSNPLTHLINYLGWIMY